jgi:hypothetical protein
VPADDAEPVSQSGFQCLRLESPVGAAGDRDEPGRPRILPSDDPDQALDLIGVGDELAAGGQVAAAQPLTHHLNAMDARGLIRRSRDAANRRVQVVTLTEAGEEAFLRLRTAAMAFDARLRDGLAEPDLATLATLLARLAANVGRPAEAVPPWAGLADHRQ